jgi:hypothetical protein
MVPKGTLEAKIKEKFSINPTLDFNVGSKLPVGNKIVRIFIF